MNSVKVYSQTFPAIFSGRLRETTAPLSHIFAPQALGSLPISGPLILCNPNLLHPPNSFLSLILAVLGPTRDIMSPKSGRPLFSPHLQDSISTAFPESLFKSYSRFFAPELKPLSSFTLRNFAYQHFFAIMVGLALSHSLKFDGYNRQRQTIRKNGAQNYRPFKWWLGCRTYIPNFFSPFFRDKDWAFFYEKSRGPSGG